MNRYIGVDLHTTQVTVCYLTENEEISIESINFVRSRSLFRD